MRIRIFIDFWNFQLAWNNFHKRGGVSAVVRIPWKERLADILVKQADAGAAYHGTHVYASIDSAREADRRLGRFLRDTMDSFPGFRVLVKERKPRSPMRCPNDDCKKLITHCPHCDQVIRRTVEKGVDTSLVVDLIQHATDDTYDRAVLVSGDADFVPAVELVQRLGKQVIHAHFRNRANELMKASWDHVFFDDMMGDLLEP